jgi:hypothetical protein
VVKNIKRNNMPGFKLRSQGGIKKAEPAQGAISKGFEMVTHPFTTMSYVAKNQSVPDRFTRGGVNAMDNVASIADPTGLSGWSDVRNSFERGDSVGEKALNIAGALPVFGMFAKAMKLSKNISKTDKVVDAAKGVVNAASKVTKSKSYTAAKAVGDTNSAANAMQSSQNYVPAAKAVAMAIKSKPKNKK